MGAGSYNHTTRASGLTLTASIYNADHENHITNHNTEKIDDYSASVSEMRTQTDPGESGSESQATNLAGELARLRYIVNEMKGTTYWYESVKNNISATAAPAVTNDVDEGYSPGSKWIDVTNDNAYICVDATDGAAVWRLAGSSDQARIATGTYTGDGATSQGITGIGFQPKYVKVWERRTSGGNSVPMYETTDTIIDDNANGIAIEYDTTDDRFESVENAIISLDSDGFTVDDAGTDSDPNKNTVVYNYLAMG